MNIKSVARNALIGAANWLVILAISIGIATAACGQERPKVTGGDALRVRSALKELDGRPVVIKQNGQDVTIVQPWDFGSGVLRLKITNDITILSAVQKAE